MKIKYSLLGVLMLFALAFSANAQITHDSVGYADVKNIAPQDLWLHDGDTGSGRFVLHHNEIIQNATDGVVTLTFDDDAVELGDLQIKSSNTGSADADYLQFSWWIMDDTSTEVIREFAQMRVYADDITSSTLDSTIKFYINTAALAATGPGEVLALSGAAITNTFQTDAAELGDYKITSSNPSTGTNDYLQISFWAKNNNATPVITELAQLVVTATNITSGTFATKLEFAVDTAGSLAKELVLTGAALSPYASAGVTLGTASLPFGAAYIEGDVTLANDEYVDNDTDNTVKIVYGGATAAIGTLDLNSASASPADNDILTFQFSGLNDNATPAAATYAKIQAKATDVTSTTLDSLLILAVNTDGTAPVDELVLSGAALYPNADGGLDLGIATSNQIGAAYIDTLYVGDAGGRKLVMGSAAVDNGVATDTLAVAGTDADDLVFVTVGEDPSNGVYLKSAVAGTGQIVVTLSGDPGTTTTYHYQVWQD